MKVFILLLLAAASMAERLTEEEEAVLEELREAGLLEELLKQEMGPLEEGIQHVANAGTLENRGGPLDPLFKSWATLRDFLHRRKIAALKTIARFYTNLVRVTGKHIGELLTLSIDEIMPNGEQVFNDQPLHHLEPINYEPIYYEKTKESTVGQLLTLGIDDIMPNGEQVLNYQPPDNLEPIDYKPFYYEKTKESNSGKHIGDIFTLSIDEIMPNGEHVLNPQPSHNLEPIDYKPFYYEKTKKSNSKYIKNLNTFNGDEVKETASEYNTPYPYWKAPSPTPSVPIPTKPYTLTEEIIDLKDTEIALDVDEMTSLALPIKTFAHSPKVTTNAPVNKYPVKVQKPKTFGEQKPLKKIIPTLLGTKIPFTNFKNLNSNFTNFISYGEPTIAPSDKPKVSHSYLQLKLVSKLKTTKKPTVAPSKESNVLHSFIQLKPENKLKTIKTPKVKATTKINKLHNSTEQHIANITDDNYDDNIAIEKADNTENEKTKGDLKDLVIDRRDYLPFLPSSSPGESSPLLLSSLSSSPLSPKLPSLPTTFNSNLAKEGGHILLETVK